MLRRHLRKWPLRALLSRGATSLSPHQRGSLDILRTLADSLQAMPKSLSKWTSADWFMRLTMLATHNSTRHYMRRNHHTPGRAPIDATHQEAVLKEMPHYIRVCDAVYASSTTGFLAESKLQIDEQDIVRAHPGGVFAPKYYLYVDHSRDEIVLVIRGSSSIQDFCTDMCMDHEPFLTGYGHRGIVHAAHWLDWNLRDEVIGLATQHPHLSVRLIGHSLGAGAAALLSTLWTPLIPRVRCVAFAPPACLTIELARACESNVVSVVCGDDCVPRLNGHNLVKLQEEVVAFDISAAFKSMLADEIQETKSIASKGIQQLREALDIVDDIKETASEMASAKSTADKSALIDKLSTQWVKLAKPALPNVEADLGQYLKANRSKLTQLWTQVDEQIERAEQLLRLEPAQLQAITQLKDKFTNHDLLVARQKLDFLATEPDNAATKQLLVMWSRLDLKMMAMEGLLKYLHDPERKMKLVAQLELLLQELGRVRSNDNAGLNAMLEPLSNQVYALLVTIKHTIQQDNFAIPMTTSFKSDKPVEVQNEPSETLLPLIEKKLFDILDSFCDELRKETTSILALTNAGTTLDDLAANDPALRTAPLYPPGLIYVIEKDAMSLEVPVHQMMTVTTVDEYFDRIRVSNDMLLDHLCTTYEARILELVALSNRDN
ncbi:hypothetical protein ACHHYP_07980 [Achlya hypogyna]|uniref:Fungal lipase-type domain-containing protein n=1 Tax=Achlya hypogyna TaxID=1202772 RepID=A0A1V9YQ08_ACHHY|nr:hypothetical protein ACHHYP_07980 [Achlya hypogyna]